MQTFSGVPAPTEESVPGDIASSPSSAADGPRPDLAKDTIQLRPMALRRIAPKPVFVDASGRNRRRLRILVATLVTPVVAYVALLISTLVGGPTIPMALLPAPPAPAAPSSAPAQPHTPKASATPTARAATPVAAGLHGSKAKPTAPATGSANTAATAAKGSHKPKGKPSTSSTGATGSTGPTDTPHPHPSHTHPHQPGQGGNGN